MHVDLRRWAFGRPEAGDRPVRPWRGSAFIAGGYAATAVAWLAMSGWLLWGMVVQDARATRIVFVNGILFLVVTTTVLLMVVHGYLARLKESEERFVRAQAELRHKDLAVRQGYVDVLDAVTGGKLILITEDELRATVGEPLLAPRALPDAKAISGARSAIAGVLTSLPVRDPDSLILAVSEALTNAVKHGGHGEYGVYLAENCLQVVVRDFGSGMDFRELPKATLIQGFSTTNTMGLGFTIMLEVAERVLLTTDESGTVVVLETGLETPIAEERTLEQILSA